MRTRRQRGMGDPVGEGGHSAMSQFLGTHQNRLDSKGRVSVPAQFRAVLRAADELSVVLRPSHRHPCIEGWPAAAFAELAAPLDTLDLFSDSHEDMQAAIYGDAYPVEPDKEGRIVVPDLLKQHAGLTEAVAFMGVGRTFQIWEPETVARYKAEARARSDALRLTLPGRRTVQ